jgi:ATP-dependent helicase YprA (DUF1998 family)
VNFANSNCLSLCLGKSLVYNLPVLESIFVERGGGLVAADTAATALYIYPTKALAQDQLQSIESLVRQIEKTSDRADTSSTFSLPAAEGLRGSGVKCNVCVVDGDTSFPQRSFAQKSGHILLTNPDMLSCTLLPNHPQWKRFFSRVRFIVIDEAHMYKGVFGSHVSAVMRRLTRVCLYYRQQNGSDFSQQPLQFVLSSATIANPVEHMCKLVPTHCCPPTASQQHGKSPLETSAAPLPSTSRGDRDREGESGRHGREPGRGCVVSVDASCDGSPSGDRYFVLWNPPLRTHAESESESESVVEMKMKMKPEEGGKSKVQRQTERETETVNEIYVEGDGASTDVGPSRDGGQKCCEQKQDEEEEQEKGTGDIRCSSFSDKKRGDTPTVAPRHTKRPRRTSGDSGMMDEDRPPIGDFSLAPAALNSSMERFLRGCEDGGSAVGSGFGPDNRARRRQKREADAAGNSAALELCTQRSAGSETGVSVAVAVAVPPPGRCSSIVQAALLFSSLVLERRRVLVFCQSRKLVEMVSLLFILVMIGLVLRMMKVVMIYSLGVVNTSDVVMLCMCLCL